MRVRMPGVKPGQKIGPLGPFRGRLGASWAMASIVLALLILGAGLYWALVVLPR